MERVWNTISGYINFFFYHRTMNRYIKAANIVKQKVDDYLREKNIKFTSKVIENSEPGWPKVAVEVIVDLDNYDEVLKLWNKLGLMAYEGIPKKDIHGVFVRVEPSYRHNKETDIQVLKVKKDEKAIEKTRNALWDLFHD